VRAWVGTDAGWGGCMGWWGTDWLGGRGASGGRSRSVPLTSVVSLALAVTRSVHSIQIKYHIWHPRRQSPEGRGQRARGELARIETVESRFGESSLFFFAWLFTVFLHRRNVQGERVLDAAARLERVSGHVCRCSCALGAGPRAGPEPCGCAGCSPARAPARPGGAPRAPAHADLSAHAHSQKTSVVAKNGLSRDDTDHTVCFDITVLVCVKSVLRCGTIGTASLGGPSLPACRPAASPSGLASAAAHSSGAAQGCP